MNDLLPNYPLPPIPEITMSEVVEYMNAVIKHYGPPCDFCAHFDFICAKNHRTRTCSLRCGPITSWNVRKKCKDFTGKQDSKDDTEATENLKRSVNIALDCNSQTYG